MSLRPPDLEDLRAIAKSNSIRLSAEEEETFLNFTHDMCESIGQLDSFPQSGEELDVVDRAPGYRPTAQEDPYNALVRRCTVRGSRTGRLAGKRIAVKDNICIAGIPLTCGSLFLQDYTPSADATVIRRVLDAGAEVVATTNMDDFGFAAAGETSRYGATLNPQNSSFLAGGSSSGSAAALFYDDIDLSLGCDQGGSIRVPSAWCGTVGLKPTFGLVPYTGILGIDSTIDHVGPIARNCADAALLLETIAGYDDKDPRGRKAPSEYVVGDLLLDFKTVHIGVLEEGFGTAGADARLEQVVHKALSIMSELGAKISAVSVPAHRQAGALLWPIVAEGMSTLLRNNGIGYHTGGHEDVGLATALAVARSSRPDDVSPQLKLTLLVGDYLKEHYCGRFYAKAQNSRPAFRAAYDIVLQQVDILALPTTPMKPHRHRRDKTLSERIADGWSPVGNTAPFDLTGHPALSIPCGKVDGLPVGLMLVGKHLDDRLLLKIGHSFERAVDWCAL